MHHAYKAMLLTKVYDTAWTTVLEEGHNFCVIQAYLGHNSSMIMLEMLLDPDTTVARVHARNMALKCTFVTFIILLKSNFNIS